MKKVCITIDAEFPDHQWNKEPFGFQDVLRALTINEVTATFFVQGKWARAYPDNLNEIIKRGHQLGSHGFTHASAAMLTPEGFKADVGMTTQVVGEIAHVTPQPWFRYPYGRAEHLDVLNDMGYASVLWDVDSEDYTNNHSPHDTVQRVGREILARDASIVLFHTWPLVTAEALDLFIKKCKQSGQIEFGVLGGKQTMEVVKDENMDLP